MGVSWSPADVARFPTADGAWVVVSGDLDRGRLERIRSEMLAATAADGRLVVDLRHATYVGAAAIGLLNEVAERASQPVSIVCSPSVRRVLVLCGLESGPFEVWNEADVLLDAVTPALVEPASQSPVEDAFGHLAATHQMLRARHQRLDRRRRAAVARATSLRIA